MMMAAVVGQGQSVAAARLPPSAGEDRVQGERSLHLPLLHGYTGHPLCSAVPCFVRLLTHLNIPSLFEPVNPFCVVRAQAPSLRTLPMLACRLIRLWLTWQVLVLVRLHENDERLSVAMLSLGQFRYFTRKHVVQNAIVYNLDISMLTPNTMRKQMMIKSMIVGRIVVWDVNSPTNMQTQINLMLALSTRQSTCG